MINAQYAAKKGWRHTDGNTFFTGDSVWWQSKLTCESMHHLWATQGLLTGKKMWSPLYSGTNMQYMQAPVKWSHIK